MKKLILVGGSLLIATSFAFANYQGNGAHGMDKWDKDQDGVISKEEATKGLAKNFELIDSDGNGEISAAELSTMQGRHDRKGNKNGKNHHRPDFKTLDTNNDGFVSAEEFNAYRAIRQAEHQARQAEHQAKQAERHAKNFSVMDSNADGKISEQEFTDHQRNQQAQRADKKQNKQKNQQSANFNLIDSNADGVISEQEFEAHKQLQQAKKQQNKQ